MTSNSKKTQKVKLAALTLLVPEINHLIDSGEEVYRWIRAERIIPFLKEKAQELVDLSIYNFDQYYHEQMKSMCHACAGDHLKKWSVEHRGLCLLLAWTNELIQQGSGWSPKEL